MSTTSFRESPLYTDEIRYVLENSYRVKKWNEADPQSFLARFDRFFGEELPACADDVDIARAIEIFEPSLIEEAFQCGYGNL
jgi:hypothetical protein